MSSLQFSNPVTVKSAVNCSRTEADGQFPSRDKKQVNIIKNVKPNDRGFADAICGCFHSRSDAKIGRPEINQTKEAKPLDSQPKESARIAIRGKDGKEVKPDRTERTHNTIFRAGRQKAVEPKGVFTEYFPVGLEMVEDGIDLLPIETPKVWLDDNITEISAPLDMPKDEIEHLLDQDFVQGTFYENDAKVLYHREDITDIG
ncbi:hypothetical protein FNU76_05180 [Chitinimonas arctica]|uniref:Uncharacterized protein n=1 Tax=Chitinimonas arctica TaxID=2594795 RepID=A0A516SCB5_9NEIS|nr:hypothetical protein [Chitinimonas arctica]QDQ25791.1 hypothetical protein FNU76_05180 [Chitinimonas arctica]